jgi:hypothetical protein
MQITIVYQGNINQVTIKTKRRDIIVIVKAISKLESLEKLNEEDKEWMRKEVREREEKPPNKRGLMMTITNVVIDRVNVE